jgi:uncharacterized protein (DUF2252 family)
MGATEGLSMRTQRRLPKQVNQKSNVISIAKRRPGLTGHYRSTDERRAEGRALRDAVPRESHRGWKAPRDRRDPIELLTESDDGRMPQLIPIRHWRMLQSPFAFYRGSAALMAADLARTPATGLRVQACGDAHLLNFGGFATPERNIIFDINDFDETLPAPWEWDLKRLAASVVIAGRHLGLRESESERAAGATVRAYREQMADYSFMPTLQVWYDRINIEKLLERAPNEKTRTRLKQRIEKARARTVAEHDFPKLAEQIGSTPLIKDNPPLIFHPTANEAPGMKTQFSEQLALYRESLNPSIHPLFDRFHFCDLAIKVVGVGSVGTRCSIALFLAADDDPLFLQIKEARASVLEPYAGKSVYSSHGERVVVGQRMIQSASDMFLGWSRAKAGFDVYVRQLHDMKISAVVEGWDFDTLRAYTRTCAWALAQAHARTGDAAMISGYMGSSETFDDAICEFAVDYADQTISDHKAFARAIRDGRIQTISDQ